MSMLYFLMPLLLVGLAAVWIFWPDRYVAWVNRMTGKMPPAMRAGAEAVHAAFPLSSSKPWYPKLLRAVGILLLLLLLPLAVISFYAYFARN